MLDKADLELYRKGTRSEAQGLGIGAATYFQRIVESQWKLLVTEIRDAAAQLGVQDLTVFEAAVKETQFSTAVRMLKDAIPSKLLILNGENPLSLLHQPLSVGLHGLSDAECLQQAADIRTVLTALLENIAEVLKDQDELKNAAARLRQPKNATEKATLQAVTLPFLGTFQRGDPAFVIRQRRAHVADAVDRDGSVERAPQAAVYHPAIRLVR